MAAEVLLVEYNDNEIYIDGCFPILDEEVQRHIIQNLLSICKFEPNEIFPELENLEE